MSTWGRLPGNGGNAGGGLWHRGSSAGGPHPRGYAPPRQDGRGPPQPRGVGDADGATAAAALEMLRCDPELLMTTGGLASPGADAETALPSGVSGRPRDRPSAAKLARERYAEALSAKPSAPAEIVDLLDLSTPTACGSSAPEDLNPSLLMLTVPSGESGSSAALPGAAAFASGSGNAATLVDWPSLGNAVPTNLWPGDVLLARYGLGGNAFYRARVVRVYSSRGSTLADIEWLRPQVGSPVDSFYACSAGVDETQNLIGLQVSEDLRGLPGVGAQSGRFCGEAAASADAARSCGAASHGFGASSGPVAAATFGSVLAAGGASVSSTATAFLGTPPPAATSMLLAPGPTPLGAARPDPF